MTRKFEFHKPVLLQEAIDFLNVRPGKKYIDATVGGGGHSAAILRNGGIVLGIDFDPKALEFAEKRLAANFKFSAKGGPASGWQISNVKLVCGNFREIDEIAREHGFGKVAGVLFDLGLSSWQIENSGKGFSFEKDEPLDMRMDPTLKVKAADLINGLTEKELYELFIKLGEEKLSFRIAKAIVSARRVKKIRGTSELANLIEKVYSGKFGKKFGRYSGRRIHPATRVFQALRIAVNDELNNLREALPKAVELLEPGGRLVVISFHSLEDRIVKREFKRMESESKRIKILTPKPIRPSPEEVEENPRARSAKLRAAERI